MNMGKTYATAILQTAVHAQSVPLGGNTAGGLLNMPSAGWLAASEVSLA
jgi:hypothetical protein